MRRSTPLAVLLCSAAVLGTAAAGIALAGGSEAPAGTLAALAQSGVATPTIPSGFATSPGTGVTGPDAALPPASAGAPAPRPTGAPAPMVTVPALTSAETLPAPSVPADESGAADPLPTGSTQAAEASPPAAPVPPATPTEPVPTAPEPVPAAPAAPAEVPVVAPYATVIGWHGDAKVAYLTFDDGPGPATGRVLDILAASGVKATFCQLGQRVVEAPEITRRVVTDGHTLCNHSWDHHSPFDALAAADLYSEIGRTQDAFTQAVGNGARYFRAPEGAFGATGGPVLQAAQRARTIPLGWGVDSMDWRKPGVDAIVANVLTAVSPGALILLHDGGGTDREQTLAALPGIIAGLQAAGYTLAAMPPEPAG